MLHVLGLNQSGHSVFVPSQGRIGLNLPGNNPPKQELNDGAVLIEDNFYCAGQEV